MASAAKSSGGSTHQLGSSEQWQGHPVDFERLHFLRGAAANDNESALGTSCGFGYETSDLVNGSYGDNSVQPVTPASQTVENLSHGKPSHGWQGDQKGEAGQRDAVRGVPPCREARGKNDCHRADAGLAGLP